MAASWGEELKSLCLLILTHVPGVTAELFHTSQPQHGTASSELKPTGRVAAGHLEGPASLQKPLGLH